MSITLTEEQAKEAATYLRFVATLEKQRNPGGGEAPGLLRVADLLDAPDTLRIIALDVFDEAFQNSRDTLGEALDKMIDAIADHIESLKSLHPSSDCECQDTLDQIAKSLRDTDRGGMIHP